MLGRLLQLWVLGLTVWPSITPAQDSARLDEAIRLAVEARYEEALELFKLELGLQPEDPLRHYLVGMTEFKLANYRNALGRFQGALQRRAEFPQVYYWMARAYQELGEDTEAKASLEAGLERFPKNADLRSLRQLLSGTLEP